VDGASAGLRRVGLPGPGSFPFGPFACGEALRMLPYTADTAARHGELPALTRSAGATADRWTC
jgi:hypothetical protein